MRGANSVSCCCVKSTQSAENLQEILKRQQQQKVASGTIVPATVAIQHIRVTKPSVLIFTYYLHLSVFRLVQQQGRLTSILLSQNQLISVGRHCDYVKLTGRQNNR